MTNIYLARHGETELNKKKVYYGFTDIALNSNGEAQCQVLKQKLMNVNFDIVITSPLIRTVNSAEIITGINKDEIHKYEELKELNFGKWEGMHYKEVEKQYPIEWKAWCDDWQGYSIPEGERFNDFYNRVETCFNKIKEEITGKTVLIVGHEGALKVIALQLLGLKVEDYWTITFKFGEYKHFPII